MAWVGWTLLSARDTELPLDSAAIFLALKPGPETQILSGTEVLLPPARSKSQPSRGNADFGLAEDLRQSPSQYQLLDIRAAILVRLLLPPRGLTKRL